MEILSGETRFVLFIDLRNELNSRTRHFWVYLVEKHQYTMNTYTQRKEIAGDMLEPKLTEIYSQEIST